MLRKFQLKISARWREAFLILAVLLISGVVQGYNMFGFPYFENDEGTYLSQAWSLLNQGQLSPYTYWYDHAPAGWIFTAFWLWLTGGAFTFGFSLNSGRVFMLLLHLASVFLVIKIGKKLTGHVWVGLLGALLFSLSPLGIYFQRRLLLDNIMVFWLLWSYYLILGTGRKLSHYVFSAVFLGIAVLTKENVVLFIPGLLLTLSQTASPSHRKFVITEWLVVFGSVASLYFLYALQKGEFFSYGTPLGGNSPHVSLLSALKFQASRGGGSIFDPHSSFWKYWLLWLKQDWLLVLLGILANLVVLVIGAVNRRRRPFLGLALLGLLFWFFLVRGGLVLEFYLTPLIPFLGLYISILIFEASRLFIRFHKTWLPPAFSVLCVLALGWYYLKNTPVSRAFPQNNPGFYIFTSQQTAGQKAAVDWARTYINQNAAIAIDDYSYLEFHDIQNPSGKVYPNAQWYLKIDQDPQVAQELSRRPGPVLNYIIKTPQMQDDLWGGASPTTSRLLTQSVYVKGFIHDGWGADIWAVQVPNSVLSQTWTTYKATFLKNGDQTIDPNQANITTSEGQSYALLRSVWMDDQTTFDQVWSWTDTHLATSNGLFAWKWGRDAQGTEKILDPGSASDADTDIALALLFAYKRWNNPVYLTRAHRVISGIWVAEVRSANHTNYLVPGNWAQTKDQLVVNPSYLFPSAYRIFAAVDSAHDWQSVVDSSYLVLAGCTSSPLGAASASVNLPPNWCGVGPDHTYYQIQETGLNSTDYSYDAVRTMWRVALDYEWYGDLRAARLLLQSGRFLTSQWQSNHRLAVGYTHDGQPLYQYESVLAYALDLQSISFISPQSAADIYQQKILPKLYDNVEEKYSFWEDAGNYYIQNWAWFGTALYFHQLPNLWSGD